MPILLIGATGLVGTALTARPERLSFTALAERAGVALAQPA
jgi:uncharacterized protein YbjT (DUF2867 family)